jgi:hypothetical protein
MPDPTGRFGFPEKGLPKFNLPARGFVHGSGKQLEGHGLLRGRVESPVDVAHGTPADEFVDLKVFKFFAD